MNWAGQDRHLLGQAMRLGRVQFTVRRLLIVVAVLTVVTWAQMREGAGWKDYAEGWWLAEHELRRGEASIYAIAGRELDDEVGIDRETGLHVTWFHTGFCALGNRDQGVHERVQGHNDHVRQYILFHGLPPNSLKQWEPELFALRDFFDARSQQNSPVPLLASGTVIVSPDGKNSVRPVARLDDRGVPDGPLWVVIGDRTSTLGECCVRSLKGKSDLLWGPRNSRFAVIRSTSQFGEKYSAIDLRTGRILRQESWY
jgi:hypothetical protein